MPANEKSREKPAMFLKNLKIIAAGLAAVVLIYWPVNATETALQSNVENQTASVLTQTAANAQKPDIQWFKERMKISEKYAESGEGILGMSWAHFFTMVLLVLFAIGALVVFIQRQRRTREILERIRKEMTNGNSG